VGKVADKGRHINKQMVLLNSWQVKSFLGKVGGCE